MRVPSFTPVFLVLLLSSVLAACSGGGDSSNAGAPNGASAPSGASTPSNPAQPSAPQLSAKAQLGKALFFDRSLSKNGNMSCASCHDPAFAYGPPNNLAVQLGSDATQSGVRAVPSLRYKDMTPAYSDQAMNPDGITGSAPGGGFMLDGRAPSLSAQAAFPLLNPIEMANASQSAVVTAIQSGPSAAAFRTVYGSDVFANVEQAFSDAGDALQAFQVEDPSFHPYTSKWDLVQGHKTGGVFTAAEKRGLALFNNTVTGAGCAACHYAGANFGGASGLMTDFTYQTLGAPRNPAIPANSNPQYYDMGLCGPDTTIHLPQAGQDDPYCGAFKVPTLRNVTTRSTFFHNSVFHSIEQVLNFYNTRDTNPEYWYPSTGGSGKPVAAPGWALVPSYVPGAQIQVFNDLPPQFQGNVDEELPMGQGQTSQGGATASDGALARQFHSQPQLTQQNIADLVCFLKTLNDGYQVPAQAPTSGPCVD